MICLGGARDIRQEETGDHGSFSVFVGNGLHLWSEYSVEVIGLSYD